MCANSEGSGDTARIRSLAWAFAVRLCDKYHNPMSWRKYERGSKPFPFDCGYVQQNMTIFDILTRSFSEK